MIEQKINILVVEDDEENRSLGNNRDVDMVPLPLVKEDRELSFTDQLGQAVGSGHITSRQRREGGGVELVDVSCSGDLLAILVDQETMFGARQFLKFSHTGPRWHRQIEREQ